MTTMLRERPTKVANRRREATARSPIPVAFKTAMSPHPFVTTLDPDMTLSEAVAEVRRRPPVDSMEGMRLQQLARELSGPHDFLAINAAGEVTKVDPEATTIDEIATPRDVRTPRGVETTRIAAFEVQAYAPVG
jgi:hypothetical protein